MARPEGEAAKERMLAVAYMLMDGERVVDVAAALGLQPYAVSKIKAKAERRGILNAAPPVAGPNWNQQSEIVARRYLRYDSQNRLSALLDRAARQGLLTAPISIRVYPSLHRRESDWQSRLDHFGALSASYVRNLMLSATSVGVSWGRTLDSVVSGIENLPSPRRDRPRGIWFVPVCGEPLGRVDDNFRSSASTLSARLAEAINGSRKHTLSLSVVPFIIPIDFKDAQLPPEPISSLSEVDVVKKLIGRVPAHAEIFGDWARLSPPRATGKRRRPWSSRLSMVLTSVGAEGFPFGQPNSEYLVSAGLTAELVRDIAVADISGLLLMHESARAPAASAHSNLFERIESHWTGISRADLIACAARARKTQNSGKPGVAGVVVAAIGKSKATVILQCMKRHSGLVSHLVIDSDVEGRLCQLVLADLRQVYGSASPPANRA